MKNLKELRTNYPIKKKRYWVSPKGQVYWKDKSGEYRELKSFVTRDGYVEYVLTKTDGSKLHLQEQRIVLLTFKGASSNKDKKQVNHKDGNRKNNNLSNLEWSTAKANIKHSFKTLGKVVWNSPKHNIG